MESLSTVLRIAAKKWMQKEVKREEKAGTRGALRKYFSLKDDETITFKMIDDELSRLNKKYPDGGYNANDLKLFRRLQQARRFMEARKADYLGEEFDGAPDIA